MPEECASPSMRRILHLDLDAFFASVEALEDPGLVGKPVVVGGRLGTRGVVSTCSYEARVHGVHSAMPINEAYRRCPQAVFLPVRHPLYRDYSARVFEIVARHSDRMQAISIDEAFVDLSAFEDAASVAREIKAEIRREVGLVVSVGLSINKLVAKVATDRGKPDGFVVVPPGTEAAFLAPLEAGRLWGVGPRTAERLARAGIRTIGEIASAELGSLASVVGLRQARELRQHARGMDDSPVETDREVKSISEEITFQRDESDRQALWQILLTQASQCESRLREHGLTAQTVSVKMRYTDFRTTTRSLTLAVPTEEADAIAEAAAALMRRWWTPERRALRLLGLRVSSLRPAPGLRQMPLDLRAPSPQEDQPDLPIA